MQPRASAGRRIPSSSRPAPARSDTSAGHSRRSHGRHRRSGGTRSSCRASSVRLRAGSTCSGVGARSSLPNNPSSGHDRSLVNSIGAVGCFGVSSSLLITTRPPHRSTAASMLLVLHANRKVCRPPEQVPNTATLPLSQGCATQPLHRAFGVADDLRIGNTALGANLGGDIVGFAVAGTVIEVVADRRVAVMSELAGRLEVPLIPARRVMHEHDARERAGAQRPSRIGRDRLMLVAVDRDSLCNHALVSHGRLHLLVTQNHRRRRPRQQRALVPIRQPCAPFLRRRSSPARHAPI